MMIRSPKSTCLLALVLAFSLGTGTGFATVLNVQQHYQEEDQWCWAASSQAILEFYHTNKTQTEIAQYGTEGLNIWNWLWGSSTYPTRNGIDLILFHFAKLATAGYSSSLLESSVRTQINARKPFVVRWGWDTGGGHFVVARGIEGSNMYLMDPWNGPTINTYSWVCLGSSHTWTHTLTMNRAPSSSVSPIISLLLR
jgi:hypothetical protein